MNKLRRIFNPTPEEELEDLVNFKTRWVDNLRKERGCSTCNNCEHIYNYSAFVTAEECICTAGLECDTVLFRVKNCPRWEYRDDIDKRIEELKEIINGVE
jgi:hypothetical protein